MKKISTLLSFLTVLSSSQVWASGVMTEVIDIPTAEVTDYHSLYANFRFYSGGGVLTKTSFGVFQRLNVGFGLDVEQLIGSATVDVNRPTLNVKFRFFDSERQLPALAIGYDGQGHFFDEQTDKYIQREKGLFLVGSGEVIVPNLNLHGGLNIYDFSDDKVYSFTGLSYLYEDVVAFNAELDNIRKARNNRINLGVRYYVTPSFSIDLAARDLWAASRKAERIVRLGYFGSF